MGPLILAISSAVTDALTDEGLPQLADGGIVLGARWLDDAMPTPRIVFVPRAFRFDGAHPVAPTVAEYRANLIQRCLYTCWTTYEVHIFAPASSPDTPAEFDLAEYLRDTVIWTLDGLAYGSWKPINGEWDPAAPAQLTPQTHHVAMRIEIAVPVIDKPTRPALAFVPAGTTGTQDVKYEGSTEAP